MDQLGRQNAVEWLALAVKTSYTAVMRGSLILPAVTLLLASAANAAPCSTTTPECTEWVTVGGQSPRVLVYRSFPLETRNEAITRALLVVHGGGRDANVQFRVALGAAYLAGALDDTILVSPRFASNSGMRPNTGGAECRDSIAPQEAEWVCDERSVSWRFGGPAAGATVTTYDFVDEILRKLARKDMFPNLKTIVVAGHSGGGMFVSRYQMSSKVHDKLGVTITYVSANPTSLAYLDAIRPTSAAYPVNAAGPGYILPPPSEAFTAFADAGKCPAYNSWPYGPQNRDGYTAPLSDVELKKQLAARPLTYLLGDLDILPLAGFDGSCQAMSQGPTRMARGLAFVKYVNEKLGAQHKVVIVPLCGHNTRCMFTADSALAALFPKQ